MNNINKYLKIVKNTVIKPSGNMDEKIIDRISHIKKSDEKLLDEKFMDYFKKSNSRLSLAAEKIKNNPGAFAALITAVLLIIVFIIWAAKTFLGGEKVDDENNQLSSSENDTE